MRIPVDLHVHSALSPCADDTASPGDLVGMARVKGLAAIALTDHQTCGNVAPALVHGERLGVLVVPAMELETIEEVHLLCYFPDLGRALAFEGEVRRRLPDRANRPEILGRQYLFDDRDRLAGEDPALLLTACSMTAEEAGARVVAMGGAVVPAHADRESYSLLNTLGTIPPGFPCRYLEVTLPTLTDTARYERFLSRYPEAARFRLMAGSDAHRAVDLLEPCMLLELEGAGEGKTSILSILESLRP